MALTGTDTTTTLNPGSGGDSMGESSVRQPDMSAPTSGGTMVKHARVVRTDDTGRELAIPMTEDTGKLILAMLSTMNDKLARMANTIP